MKQVSGGVIALLSFVGLLATGYALLVFPTILKQWADQGLTLRPIQKLEANMAQCASAYWYLIVPVLLLGFTVGLVMLFQKNEGGE